jgi:hypothetical protein
MPRLRLLAAAALVAAFVVLAVKLALAPLYGMYDADECRAAYAKAATMSDTLRVDLHPYASPLVPERRRCGEVRTRPASDPSDLIVARPHRDS